MKKKYQESKLPILDEIISLDKKVRELKTEGDNLRKTRNTTSEHYPYAFYAYNGGYKIFNHTRDIAIQVRGIHGAL